MNSLATTFVMLPRLLLKRQTCAVSMRCAAVAASSSSAPTQQRAENEGKVPLKYSQSKAASWKSLDTFKKPDSSRLRYEPLVVSFSLAVFLIYFGILREENDLDQEMDKTLFQRIPALEKTQLQIQIQENKRQGVDSSELQKRLQEVEAVIKKRKSL